MTLQKTELKTPALRDLLEWWLTRAGGGTNPPRASALSPVALGRWKDHMVVFEVVDEDAYVYTFYGRALVEAFGHSRLGATLDELPEAQRAVLASEYAGVIAGRQPVSRIYTADFDGTTRCFERLVLPLRGPGDVVDKLLVAAYELPVPETPPLPETPAVTEAQTVPATSITAPETKDAAP